MGFGFAGAEDFSPATFPSDGALGAGELAAAGGSAGGISLLAGTAGAGAAWLARIRATLPQLIAIERSAAKA